MTDSEDATVGSTGSAFKPLPGRTCSGTVGPHLTGASPSLGGPQLLLAQPWLLVFKFMDVSFAEKIEVLANISSGMLRLSTGSGMLRLGSCRLSVGHAPWLLQPRGGPTGFFVLGSMAEPEHGCDCVPSWQA